LKIGKGKVGESGKLGNNIDMEIGY